MQLEQAQEIASKNNQTIYNDSRNIRLEGNNPPNDFTTFSKYQFKNMSEDNFNMIAATIDKGLRCPDCNNEDIWDVDCDTCVGYYEVWVEEDTYEQCPDCNGYGIKQDWFECSKCHHIWEEL